MPGGLPLLQDNVVLLNELTMHFGQRIKFLMLTFRAFSFHQRNFGLCVVHLRKKRATLFLVTW